MMRRVILLAILLLAQAAQAHRLDEYVQAMLLTLAPGRLQATLRLAPGMQTAPAILAAIDSDGNGVLSAPEQQRYAQQVARDLTLTVDGRAVPLTVNARTFSTPADLRAGTGEMTLDIAAPLPPDAGRHTLVLTNRHMRGRAVYLMNTLVPDGSAVVVVSQHRASDQATYTIVYGARPVSGTASTTPGEAGRSVPVARERPAGL